MCSRHSSKVALVIACLVALSAGGAALARTPGQSSTSSATAPLYSRVLQLGDLEGFWSVTCPVAVTSAAQWSTDSESERELSRNGFLNGLREPLRSSSSTVRGSSAVAQFRTPAGAMREEQAEADQVPASAGAVARFDVRQIPGSQGYSLRSGDTSRIVVSYTQGRFQYVLELTGVGPAAAAKLRERLVAAAIALARRGHGQS